MRGGGGDGSLWTLTAGASLWLSDNRCEDGRVSLN